MELKAPWSQNEPTDIEIGLPVISGNPYSILYIDGSGNLADSTTFVYNSGNVGIGTTSPTAKLHIAAGVAAANGAPLKLTPGVLLTTPELGAIEMTDDGTTAHIYMTVRIATVVTRVQVV